MTDFDLVVIGGGPAGQKAAVQGAKAGARVLLIERAKSAGGACVRYGTIPSKTLRETALSLGKFRRLTAHVMDVEMPSHLQVSSLMERKEEVIGAHERYMQAQLARNGIDLLQGVARFSSPEAVEVTLLDGGKRTLTSRHFVIAAGSPRAHPRQRLAAVDLLPARVTGRAGRGGYRLRIRVDFRGAGGQSHDHRPGRATARLHGSRASRAFLARASRLWR